MIATNNLKDATEAFVNQINQINPDLKTNLIEKSFQYSYNAHHDQIRKSGEPFLAHPVAVAIILAEQNLDQVTISAGLLHDVVEDTDITIEQLSKLFGKEISKLVDGVTKIDALQVKSRYHRQAETYRKMLLSMAEDLRVIIIKFADRLHNLRTLRYLKPERVKAIAQETLDIYAPLAHRLGMARIKWELEDLAFKHLYPNQYNEIISRIVGSRHEREKIIESFVSPLRNRLQNIGINASIIGRPKHFYSIYRKIIQRNVPFNEIFDLLALRIITNSEQDCYIALGIIHSMWKPIQERFKDYIGMPKSNEYKSLHTTVVGSDGHIIEMQIRTWEMNSIAEDGIAAHWLYKDGTTKIPSKDDKAIAWLKNLIEWQKDLTDSAEFYEFFRVDLFHAEIFVFTPKGDLITLPKGATVLDFAFAVHTDIGLHCIGARVDGKVEAINKVIRSGCTVEILNLSSKVPSSNWLRDVHTSKARSGIKRWLKHTSHKDSIIIGKNIVENEFNKRHLSKDFENHISDLLKYLDIPNKSRFYEMVGKGNISTKQIVQYFTDSKMHKSVSAHVSSLVDTITGKKRTLIIGGKGNIMIRYAACCHPVPGDEIIGFMTKGRGIAVHRKDCKNSRFFIKENDRAVSLVWEDDKKTHSQYTVFLEIVASNRIGLLKDIATIFTKNNAEIISGEIQTADKHVTSSFQIQIVNTSHLKQILRSISKIKDVEKVARTKNSKRLT